MKFSSIIGIAAVGATFADALSIPQVSDLTVRDALPDFLDHYSSVETVHDLFRRKGGGGKGGSSGGGSSSSGSGSSGSGSSGSGSSGSGSSGSGSSGSGSSGSGSRPASSGGSGSSGSGSGSTGSRGTSVSPTYGGGRYYGGGATSSYSSGQRSPRGISPFLLATPFLIFPGLWLYDAYAYPYSHPYTFYNRTATNSSNPNGVNETKPVQCLCQEYNPCGCDDNGNTTYLDEIVGNGSYAALNKSLVNVADVNGTSAIYINGTLPNGTDSSSSSGSSSTPAKGAAAGLQVAEWMGYWVMGATVLFTVYGL